MIKPDSARVSKLLFYSTAIVLFLYSLASLRKLYVLHTSPESISADAISPYVELTVVFLIVLTYGLYRLVGYLRHGEERAFLRKYGK
ncbi:hypothetical protein K8B33_11280 [Alcanivorax sp. JB21]|nr:hypothetical protein [Alcanivorax limicola]